MSYPILVTVRSISCGDTCPGRAAMRLGEAFVFDARTPASGGMCVNAFHAILPLAMAMRLSDRVEGHEESHVDLVCPHGRVTYRLSRAEAES